MNPDANKSDRTIVRIISELDYPEPKLRNKMYHGFATLEPVNFSLYFFI